MLNFILVSVQVTCQLSVNREIQGIPKRETFINFDCKNNTNHFITTLIFQIGLYVYLLFRQYVSVCYDGFFQKLYSCDAVLRKN